MNRRFATIISLTLAAIVVVAGIIYWFSTYVPVVFKTDNYVSSVNIIKDNTLIQQTKPNQTVWLPKGDIKVQLLGSNLSSDQQTISVTKSETFTLQSAYNRDYLDDLAISATPSLQTLLNQNYPNVIGNYTLTDVRTYQHGEWASALLTDNQSSSNNTKDFYRVVFQKTNNTWKIINKPSLYIKSKDSSIPRLVANTVNAQIPERGY